MSALLSLAPPRPPVPRAERVPRCEPRPLGWGSGVCHQMETAQRRRGRRHRRAARAFHHPQSVSRVRERLMIAVSFDPVRGYSPRATRLPVLAALSLSGLLRGHHAPMHQRDPLRHGGRLPAAQCRLSQFPNLSTGMGGRGGSPLAAGGAGRSRRIRVRAENTSLSCPRLASTSERALSETGIEHET